MSLGYAEKYLMKASDDYWFEGMIVRRPKMNCNSEGFCKIIKGHTLDLALHHFFDCVQIVYSIKHFLFFLELIF